MTVARALEQRMAPVVAIERHPPQDLEAERAVLGSIIIDRDAIHEALDVISGPDSFSRQGNGLIYQAILNLYGRGVAPDLVTVAEELDRTGNLDAAGGPSYLSQLGNETPTSVHVAQYGQVVERKATLRRLIVAAGKIAAIGYEDGANVSDALERAYLEFCSVGGPKERTKFAKAGFRSYALAAADDRWRLVLSRVDVTASDPKGLVHVYSLGHPLAQEEMGGYLFCRSVGLYGGTNLGQLAKELGERLGEPQDSWRRRIDYLIQKAIRTAQAAAEAQSLPTGRPAARDWIFERRLAKGLTFSIFGPGSAGKTTLVDGLLLSAFHGVEIIPDWRPRRHFRVGLLDWDETRNEAAIRQYAIANGYGLPTDPLPYRKVSRPLSDCADEIGRWIVEEGIEFLALGPVKRALRDMPGDPAGPVNELYEVLSEFGTTNLLIDHVAGSLIGKQADREYGSVSKRDNARTSYSLYPQSEEIGTRVVVLRLTKPDPLLPKHPPQAIQITYDPADPGPDDVYESIVFSRAQVTETVAQPTSSGRENEAARLVRILRENGPMDCKQIAAVHGCSADRVRKVVNKARSQLSVAIVCTQEGIYSLGEAPSDALV